MSDEDSQRQPTRESRPWASTFIVAFLAVQVALPVSYYLGDDIWDERFAWRMFSTVRLTGCDSGALREFGGSKTQRVLIWRDVQLAWRNLIERNRDQVARAWLRRQCRQTSASEMQVWTVCTRPGGERSRHVWTRKCESGELEREDSILNRDHG